MRRGMFTLLAFLRDNLVQFPLCLRPQSLLFQQLPLQLLQTSHVNAPGSAGLSTNESERQQKKISMEECNGEPSGNTMASSREFA